MELNALYREKDVKETAIGRLPRDWEVMRLGDLILEAKSGFACGKRDENGILQLRMDSIDTEGWINPMGGVKVPVPENVEEYVLRPGDIMFNNTNSVDLIGKTAIFRGEFPRCVYSNHLTRIRVDFDKVVPKWILYALVLKWQLGVPKAICHRHVHQAGINNEEILALELALPPYSEQEKITGILSAVDEAIQKTDEIIAKTELLKKGLMQKLLTKGIGHKEFRDTDIGTIPRQWKATTVGRECIVGTGGTPSRKHAEYFGGSIPWVKSTEVDYGVITQTEERITELGLQNSNAKIDPKGTLVMAMYGQGITRGKCAILGIDAAINQACAAITPRNSDIIYIPYLYHWCQSRYEHIRNLGQGANQPNLNLSLVRSVKVALPSFPEQRRIAQTLSTADKKLELERDEKAKLERIKRGVMDLLLTGKIRVRVS